jgi:hypothetical protein
MGFEQNALRKLMTDKVLAQVIDVSPTTLRRWRKQNKGPPFRKFGTEPNGPVRYDPQEVAEWIARCTGGGDRQLPEHQR